MNFVPPHIFNGKFTVCLFFEKIIFDPKYIVNMNFTSLLPPPHFPHRTAGWNVTKHKGQRFHQMFYFLSCEEFFIVCSMFYFLDHRLRNGPMNSVPSVCLSVCQSVTNFSQNWVILFFWFLVWRSGFIIGSKVTEPDFSGKIPFAQIWTKRAQNGLKMRFLEFWQKSKPLMCTFFCLKWKNSWSSIILRKTIFRGKSCLPKLSTNPIARFFKN